MTQSQKNDKKALLYLKAHGITEIEQVTAANRKDLYAILDGKEK